MPKVTFLPLNRTVECSPGETLLDVAVANDIPMQHACGGFCACTTCQVIVKSGADHVSEMEEDEEERLDKAGIVNPDSRLSCQTRVQGDITVQIVNLE